MACHLSLVTCPISLEKLLEADTASQWAQSAEQTLKMPALKMFALDPMGLCTL